MRGLAKERGFTLWVGRLTPSANANTHTWMHKHPQNTQTHACMMNALEWAHIYSHTHTHTNTSMNIDNCWWQAKSLLVTGLIFFHNDKSDLKKKKVLILLVWDCLRTHSHTHTHKHWGTNTRREREWSVRCVELNSLALFSVKWDINAHTHTHTHSHTQQ